MLDHEYNFDQQVKASLTRAQSDATAINRMAQSATSTCGQGGIGGSIKPLNTAPALLQRAATIMVERGKQYDKPDGERSMGKAVDAFNSVKGKTVLQESDGWLLMALLKMVRDQQRSEPHQDSCEDGIAYMALYGESRLKGGK